MIFEKNMNFDESVSYLYALGNEVLAMKLGLENIGKVLTAIGNPQNNFLKVQVAGTNGKGSTCAFLDAICRSANIKTGLYTSPHLVSITERIKINGDEISENDFARHATHIREISENLVENGELEAVPTYFEQVTAIAISTFGEANIELGILETGLGGRFDAVTVVNAEVVAITPIDYDHQHILGNTLTEIAGEKAAIINSKNQKVVVSKQPDEAEKVILNRCQEFELESLRTNFELPNVELSLRGNHQVENAKVAVRLAEILKIDKQNIINGLQTATHNGRLEFSNEILFDGAHNISGAKALRDYLNEFINQPITLIFGAMRDKDLTEIAEILFPVADKLILTKPDNPRSALPENLAKFATHKVYLTESVSEALTLAKKFPQNLTCVTGSLYLVGEAQKILSENV